MGGKTDLYIWAYIKGYGGYGISSLLRKILRNVFSIFIIYSDLLANVLSVAVPKNMQYLYCFANTSLVMRLLTYLSKQPNYRAFPLFSVTVIYLVDRWVVRIRMDAILAHEQDLDFRAFLNENGYPYALSAPIARALNSLDAGMSVTDVMNKHHVVVVSHGALQTADIEDFRLTFVRGLGYCPPSLV